MSNEGGSVTLIFYKIDSLWKEPFLNLLAAAAQMSNFTHVEIAIGNEAGHMGQMSNVCRIFNDSVGVELTSRTGRNPQYSYLSLGCSKRAEKLMLAYAQTLVGRPFSNVGMARSLIFPRATTGDSFFCAELVASVLQKGGLMSASSNPGSATPESLHRLYKGQAAVTANPYTLRLFNMNSRTTPMITAPSRSIGFKQILDAPSGAASSSSHGFRSGSERGLRRRGDSPPRASFRCVNVSGHGVGGRSNSR